MGRSDLGRLIKYLMAYAIDKRVKESSRGYFYSLIETAEGTIALLPEEEAAEQAGATSNEIREFEADQQNAMRNSVDLNGNSNEITHYLMTEILDSEAKKGRAKSQNSDSVSDSSVTSSSKEAEPVVISDYVPGIFYRQRTDNEEDSLQPSAQRNNHEINNSALNLLEEADEFDDLEDNADPEYNAEDDDLGMEEEDLDFESLQARLPPYALLSRKKKKKFFKNLNEEFNRKIQKRSSNKRIKKVNFNVKANQVVTFFKDAKIIK